MNDRKTKLVQYFERKINENRNEAMRKRVSDFIRLLDVNTTKFCARVNVSHSVFYRWKNAQTNLSDHKLDRMEFHISKYGF